MIRRIWLLPLIAAFALPAPAAASWSAPQRLSEPISSVGGPGSGFDTRGPYFDVDQRGRWFTFWGFHSGRSGGDFFDGIKSNWRAPSGRWSDERTQAIFTSYMFRGGTLGLSWPATDYGVTGGSRLLLVTLHIGPRQTPDQVEVDSGTSGGRFSKVERLGRPGNVGAARLAVVGGGAAVLAWPYSPSSRDQARVILSRRRGDGRWTSPVALSRPGAGDVAVAGAGHTMLVAWARGDRIEGRLSTTSGRTWRRLALLGRTGISARRRQIQISAAVGRGGQAVVAWFARAAPTGDGRGGMGRYRVAYRPAGAGFGAPIGLDAYRFAPALDLDAGSGGLPLHVEAAFDSTGQALVAWQGGGLAANEWNVKAASVGAQGAATPQVVSGDGPARLDDLAVGPSGQAAAAFSRLVAPESFDLAITAAAAVRPAAGQPFAPPELIHQPALALTRDLTVRLAFGRAGALASVWTELVPGGGGAVFAADRQ